MRILLVTALLLTPNALIAQNHKAQKEKLRFTLIASRHGIRPPLVDVSAINSQAAQPWPGWEVAPGLLTPHGADALRQMGAYMRLDFARDGLFPATGCPAASDIYLYADTDSRNIASTRATYSGLAPGCGPLPVTTYIPGHDTRDPLFLPVPRTFPAPPADAAVAAMRAALHSDPETALSAKTYPELNLMAHVLAPNPAMPAAKPILAAAVDVHTNKSGDPIVTNTGPLSAASTLVEDLLLEYADNKPMPEVGWGRVDEGVLRRLIPLHVAAFGLSHRTMFFARAESSNMLAHVLDTLDQTATQTVTRGAIGPTGTRLVYISAHDTNLTGLGGLLGVQWTADGITNDTPPDSQIVFELWSRPGSKKYDVRLRYRAQTLKQLRSASALTLNAPPAEVTLVPPGCEKGRPCPFEIFRKAVLDRLDPAYVLPDLLPTQVAP